MEWDRAVIGDNGGESACGLVGGEIELGGDDKNGSDLAQACRNGEPSYDSTDDELTLLGLICGGKTRSCSVV
jgi:hypothetical protein